MSIINDALKKAQKTISSADAQAKKNPVKRYPIYIIVLIFGVAAEFVVLSLILRTPAKPKRKLANIAPSTAAAQVVAIAATSPSAPVAIVQPVPVEKASPALSLNGIFYSENKGYYALINNRIAKIGDNIDGAVVKSINLDEVRLAFDGKVIRLRN